MRKFWKNYKQSTHRFCFWSKYSSPRLYFKHFFPLWKQSQTHVPSSRNFFEKGTGQLHVLTNYIKIVRSLTNYVELTTRIFSGVNLQIIPSVLKFKKNYLLLEDSIFVVRKFFSYPEIGLGPSNWIRSFSKYLHLHSVWLRNVKDSYVLIGSFLSATFIWNIINFLYYLYHFFFFFFLNYVSIHSKFTKIEKET